MSTEICFVKTEIDNTKLNRSSFDLWSGSISSKSNYRWTFPDSKVHVANKGLTWVLPAPGKPHVGPMNFAIWECSAAF